MSKKHRVPINPEEWMNYLIDLRGEEAVAPIRFAINLHKNINPIFLDNGLEIADILLSLKLDNETLALAVIYPALLANEIFLDCLTDYFNEHNIKLLHDLLNMRSLGKFKTLSQRNKHQIENLRKMLLAMATDIRAVFIILAQRLYDLRQSKNIEKIKQQALANESLNVYAPLANRLGIWQIKWEIEDLCLRYLHPDTYKTIAKSIASKRNEREVYIQNVLITLNEMIQHAGIKNFQSSGRAKHIYSIYKKMQHKNYSLEQIYDMSAIRFLVQNIEDCYSVLGLLQNTWPQIPEEFDDYIAHPKENGYRSIHMVLIGPHDHFVEVQIRTYQMHQESELGIAAHWGYKEGILQTNSYTSKIALLRQIIEWQKEMTGDKNVGGKVVNDIFADRIYVFTPMGDIVDLSKGSTPLDFAYTIHSEVGHRCRGAKIDGHIVPLTYALRTGQRVEILTAKEAKPSRDWMNVQAGYLKSSRNRAKVQHWFRVKDGWPLVSKELSTVPAASLNKTIENTPNIPVRMNEKLTANIYIVGINKLLTHIAKCCHPTSTDAVIGYVTRTRGISIHKITCGNIVNATQKNQDRVIQVSWDEHKK